MSERATVRAAHLHHCTCVDVRQSTIEQVEHNRVDQTRCAMNERATVSAVHLHRRTCVDVRQSQPNRSSITESTKRGAR
jgi:hypothetical protein